MKLEVTRYNPSSYPNVNGDIKRSQTPTQSVDNRAYHSSIQSASAIACEKFNQNQPLVRPGPNRDNLIANAEMINNALSSVNKGSSIKSSEPKVTGMTAEAQLSFLSPSPKTDSSWFPNLSWLRDKSALSTKSITSSQSRNGRWSWIFNWASPSRK